MSQARGDLTRDPSPVARTMERIRERKEQVRAAFEATPDARPQGKVVASNPDRARFIEALAVCGSLTPIERLVGVRLAFFLNLQTGQLNPTFETIAASTSISLSSAKRHVQALIDAGWVMRTGRRGRVSNDYALVIATVSDR